MATEAAEAVRRELEPQVRDIIEASGSVTLQYALDRMTDDFFENEEPGLGRAVVYNQGTMLFFAASAAVALNAILNLRDSDEETEDEAIALMRDSYEKLEAANKQLIEAEERFLGDRVDA